MAQQQPSSSPRHAHFKAPVLPQRTASQFGGTVRSEQPVRPEVRAQPSPRDRTGRALGVSNHFHRPAAAAPGAAATPTAPSATPHTFGAELRSHTPNSFVPLVRSPRRLAEPGQIVSRRVRHQGAASAPAQRAMASAQPTDGSPRTLQPPRTLLAGGSQPLMPRRESSQRARAFSARPAGPASTLRVAAASSAESRALAGQALTRLDEFRAMRPTFAHALARQFAHASGEAHRREVLAASPRPDGHPLSPELAEQERAALLDVRSGALRVRVADFPRVLGAAELGLGLSREAALALAHQLDVHGSGVVEARQLFSLVHLGPSENDFLGASEAASPRNLQYARGSGEAASSRQSPEGQRPVQPLSYAAAADSERADGILLLLPAARVADTGAPDAGGASLRGPWQPLDEGARYKLEARGDLSFNSSLSATSPRLPPAQSPRSTLLHPPATTRSARVLDDGSAAEGKQPSRRAQCIPDIPDNTVATLDSWLWPGDVGESALGALMVAQKEAPYLDAASRFSARDAMIPRLLGARMQSLLSPRLEHACAARVGDASQGTEWQDADRAAVQRMRAARELRARGHQLGQQDAARAADQAADLAQEQALRHKLEVRARYFQQLGPTVGVAVS
ncbi:hypothetical protein T492DRAFT_1147660 [Pavlovales sp. CCMP2436]|nr:hypothetical protein T492DRAFT_1147660 [Pavlovales sp. CCMP2436]